MQKHRVSSASNNVVAVEFGGRRPVLRVHLLGAFHATSYLGEDVVPRGRKTRALLGYLCWNAGQRVPRSRLASLLWDRVPDQQAKMSLRQALRDLSIHLGPLFEELISTDCDSIKLEARACWI